MAGFVKVNYIRRRSTGELHIYPIPCPAVKDANGKRTSCLHSFPEEPFSACPFMYKTMAYVEGKWVDHVNIEALVTDMEMYPEERNGIRVCCLRVEAGDTPIGAS